MEAPVLVRLPERRARAGIWSADAQLSRDPGPGQESSELLRAAFASSARIWWRQDGHGAYVSHTVDNAAVYRICYQRN